jgi:hypothetical protein
MCALPSGSGRLGTPGRTSRPAAPSSAPTTITRAPTSRSRRAPSGPRGATTTTTRPGAQRSITRYAARWSTPRSAIII